MLKRTKNFSNHSNQSNHLLYSQKTAWVTPSEKFRETFWACQTPWAYGLFDLKGLKNFENCTFLAQGLMRLLSDHFQKN